MRRLMFAAIAFAAPFVVFWLYDLIRRRRAALGRSTWPVTILFLTAAILAGQTFVLAALTEKSQPVTYYEDEQK